MWRARCKTADKESLISIFRWVYSLSAFFQRETKLNANCSSLKVHNFSVKFIEWHINLPLIVKVTKIEVFLS
jgi:hypothetical protein